MPANPSQPESTTRRINALTSMRFAAALLVFLHHIEGSFGVPELSIPLRKIAVSFFFVLSGFVLTIVYAPRAQKLSTRDFLKRRFLRIYPLHWAILLFSIVVLTRCGIWQVDPNPAQWLSRLAPQLLLVQTWIVGWTSMAFNGVTWSLSVLVAMYLVFPTLIRRTAWLPRITVAALGLSVSAVIGLGVLVSQGMLSLDTAAGVVHFFPPLRASEFLFGMLAAVAFMRTDPGSFVSRLAIGRWATVVDIALLIVAIGGWQLGVESLSREWFRRSAAIEISLLKSQVTAAASEQTAPQQAVAPETAQEIAAHQKKTRHRRATIDPNSAPVTRLSLRWWSYAGFFGPAAAIIYWFSLSRGWLARCLELPAIVYLGELSFAFFLVHRPLILLIDAQLGEFIGPRPWLGAAYCAAVTVVASIVFHHGVELWSLRALGRREHKQPATPAVATAGRTPRLLTACCLTLAALLPLVGPWREDRVAVLADMDQAGRFDNGVAVAFECLDSADGVRCEVTRSEGFQVGGRLVIHFIDAQGEILGRLPVGNLSSHPKEERWTSGVWPSQFWDKSQYARLSLVRENGGLSSVVSGPADQAQRGLVLKLAGNAAPMIVQASATPKTPSRRVTPLATPANADR